MSVAITLFAPESAHGHDTGPGHPERAARLDAVEAALTATPIAGLVRATSNPADLNAIRRVHDDGYVRRVLDAIPTSGLGALDGDTVLSPGSGKAALDAAGAVIAAVDAVMAGATRAAFCAVRPPGHHAEPARGMGFCLFNNIAIGAAHGLAAHGVSRIAIVDFDVHHGNGTAAAFAAESRVLFASTHQFPLYPGTGRREDRGVGNIINVPLAPGAGSAAFRAAYQDEICPALRAFAPELVLVSAGFDGHREDPLAGLMLEAADFAWVTAELVEIARNHAQGRIVSALEGGYNLDALQASVAAHIGALAQS